MDVICDLLAGYTHQADATFLETEGVRTQWMAKNLKLVKGLEAVAQLMIEKKLKKDSFWPFQGIAYFKLEDLPFGSCSLKIAR